MDKNTIIGFVLIAAVLIGFSYFSRPSQEEIERIQHYNDSVAVAQQQAEAVKAVEKSEPVVAKVDSSALFAISSQGEVRNVVIENNLLKLEVSNKGGYIADAVLKKYNDQQGKPLTLFGGDDIYFNFKLNGDKTTYSSNNYYFTPVESTDTTVTMRWYADAQSYVDFKYALSNNSYIVRFSISPVNMGDKLSTENKYIDINWVQYARQQERSAKFENRYAELMYRTVDGDVDNLSVAGSDNEEIEGLTQWIGYKNQFFSTAWICDNGFSNTKVESIMLDENKGYLKKYTTNTRIDFDASNGKAADMLFYIGPNHYNTMKDVDDQLNKDYELNRLVNLGWVLIRWVNRFFTIPIFDWLSSKGMSMGLILLIMTVIVKLVVLPFQYKSFMSTAKMKALKPEIDKINAKYPNQEDAMRKQQETMALYSRYGVSPMGGCLPMLLQLPIIFALFMFVPSAIELRQQSFLWADDLSAYDALISWNAHVPLIGNHISLFCLLMSVTNIVNTYYMQKHQQPMQQQEGMAFMKWFMYLMPIMFIFILNDYPAGLNYYYFLSTIFSIIIMIIMDKTLDKEKLRAKLEANMKENMKNPARKSSFMQRLEMMQKEQEKIMQEQKKNRK